MEITVNGEVRSLPQGLSVRDMLESLGLAENPCAVEVNKKLVPKRQHDQTALREGDAVEIVTLVGGG